MDMKGIFEETRERSKEISPDCASRVMEALYGSQWSRWVSGKNPLAALSRANNGVNFGRETVRNNTMNMDI